MMRSDNVCGHATYVRAEVPSARAEPIDVAAIEARIDALASGRLYFSWAGRHIATKLSPQQRARLDEARRAGYLVARPTDKPLRALWARRADLLRVPDVVVTERPKRCAVHWDLIQTGKRLPESAIASLRDRLRPRRALDIYDLVGEVRGLDLATAKEAARLVLATFEATAEARRP